MDPVKKSVFDQVSGNIRAIPGVGKKTEQKFRQAGIMTKSDLKGKAPDELAKQIDVSESRARTLIENAGFVPRMTEQELQDELARTPDLPRWSDNFDIDPMDKNRADNKQILRDRKSAEIDRRFRAAITTDFDLWSNNMNRYDFPGVDTPVPLTDELVERKPKDLG
jgi:nucleotidyltransferase/DNA polymerase involved in DNA repair